MHATLSTFTLVPLFILLAIRFRRDLLALAIASSVLQSASVLDLSFGAASNGIQIWIPLLVVSCLVSIARQPEARPAPLGVALPLRKNYGEVICITVFFAYAVVSAFVLPFIFQGIPFDVGMTGRQQGSTLAFNSTNMSQPLYLVLNAIVFYLCAARQTAKGKQRIITFYVNACCLSGLIGIYQFISSYSGWYFPRRVFYSNAAYAQLYGAMAGDLHRLNATFSEASMAALFFAGAFGVVLARCAAPSPGRGDVMRCILLAVVLTLTFSTTAYLTLFVGLSYFVIKIARRSLRSTQAAALGLLGAVILVGLLFATNQSAEMTAFVQQVTEEVLVNKTQSKSYVERHRADLAALDLFRDTSFLGAGLGSCRPSSALLGLLANTGLIGAGTFCLCIVGVFIRRRSRNEQMGFRESILLGLALMLVAHAAAVPDLTYPGFWGFLGIAAGRAGVARASVQPVEQNLRVAEQFCAPPEPACARTYQPS